MKTNKYVIIVIENNKVSDCVICEEDNSEMIHLPKSRTWAAYRALQLRHPNLPNSNYQVFQLRKKPECAGVSEHDTLPPGSYSI